VTKYYKSAVHVGGDSVKSDQTSILLPNVICLKSLTKKKAVFEIARIIWINIFSLFAFVFTSRGSFLKCKLNYQNFIAFCSYHFQKFITLNAFNATNVKVCIGRTMR
jgi:hypothetical protein